MKSGLIFSLLLSPLLAKHILVETEDQVDKKKYKERKGDDFQVCIDIYLWLHFIYIIYIMIHKAECLSSVQNKIPQRASISGSAGSLNAGAYILFK